MGELVIDLGRREWEVAISLSEFCDPDERLIAGMLLLTSDGVERRWWAASGPCLATEPIGPDRRRYEVLVSPRLVVAALRGLGLGGTARLVVPVGDDTGGPMRVEGPGVSLAVAADGRGPKVAPAHREALRYAEGCAGATAVVDGASLGEMAGLAAHRAEPPPDDDPFADRVEDPLFFLSVDEGDVLLEVTWPELGYCCHRIEGRGQGRARRVLAPGWVSRAAQEWTEPVTVTVPDDEQAPVRFQAGRRVVLVQPVEVVEPSPRQPLEEAVAEAFGTAASRADDSGDYHLAADGTPVVVSLGSGPLPGVRVRAVVLEGLPCSPELLVELNDHNAGLERVRTYWRHDQVRVETDLPADGLDGVALASAVAWVGEVVEHLGPALAAVYGGTVPAADPQQRWDAYASAIIEAELDPDWWTNLNGDTGIAVELWPFEAPVHVVTAFNPGGRPRSDDVNMADNAQLAAALIEAGAGVARSCSVAPDRSHPEASLLAWGIDRATAVDVGRRFGQDAVFELTADQVLVVPCEGDEVIAVPRVPQRSPAV